VIEGHPDRALRDAPGIGLLGDQRLEVQDLEHPLEADQGAHHLDPGAGQRGERSVQPGQQQRERDDGTRVELSAQRIEAAEAVHQRECQRRHQC
jgi:hypothetical protein